MNKLDFNKSLLNVIFIGGIEEGKTSIIKSLWPLLAESSDIETVGEESLSEFSISEDVSGRGIMSFNIIELPPILFSLQEKWISMSQNIDSVKNADVIVFVLPASCFGYGQELDFIKKMIYQRYITKQQHFVICLNKSDIQLCEKEEAQIIKLDSISELFDTICILYNSFKKHINTETFSVDSIVPFSAILNWNSSRLKEKIWEGIISKANELTYNPNLPTVVIAGKRGCGKTSTLNQLWNLQLPINKAVACTKYPIVIHISDRYENKDYDFNLIDLPGIAESLNADMYYADYYNKFIKKASILICLSQADTRAYKQDALFYHNLMENNILTSATQIILGINQIDLLFKSKENPNGIDLSKITDENSLITDKVLDYFDNVYKSIFSNMPHVSKDNIVVFSAWENWNMENLRKKLYNKLKF
jgi:small GTP-binding protein